MIAERRIEVPGGATRYLEVEGPNPDRPVIFVHGNPSNAEDWTRFLDRLEGRRRAIAPDLLGWGKSDRPDDFHWTMENLARWFGDLIDALGIQAFDLVVHDWGGVTLLTATRRPDVVKRLVILNTVPLTPEYRWHWIARLWRRRGVGELLNATTSRFGTRQLLRPATTKESSIPELVDRIHEHFDRGTKRAILELYRDADPEKFGPLGQDLAKLTCPALVVWGDADPYIGPPYADHYADALGGETSVVHVPDAGHWVWVDRPDVVETVAEFLERG